MKPLLCLICALGLALTVFVSPTKPAWGGRPCAPVGAAQPAYHWVEGKDADQVHLFEGPLQIGTYRRDTGEYFTFDGVAWAAWATPSPIAPPISGRTQAAPEHVKLSDGRDVLTGVVPGTESTEPSYRINGRAATKQDVLDAIGGPTLPDDSAYLRLTALGSKAKTDEVAKLVSGLPAESKVLFQAYTTDAPMIAGLGFHAGADPTIYLQKPDGSVLSRSEGPVSSAQLSDALRRADPKYDPAKDPDLTKPPPAPPPAPKPNSPDSAGGLPAWLWALLAALGVGGAGVAYIRRNP